MHHCLEAANEGQRLVLDLSEHAEVGHQVDIANPGRRGHDNKVLIMYYIDRAQQGRDVMLTCKPVKGSLDPDSNKVQGASNVAKQIG